MVQDEPIRIVAAVIRDDAGRVLLVRKRGTRAFMQPGGKIEPGESDLDALSRELSEEIGVALDPDAARPLGTRTAPAANEPGRTVEARLYEVRTAAAVTVSGEIEEARWVDPSAADGIELAPLTRDHVLTMVA